MWLVNISYHNEITFQKRVTKPHKKPKELGKTTKTNSKPTSTITVGNNSLGLASTTKAVNNRGLDFILIHSIH